MASSKTMGAVHREGLRKMSGPEREALEKELRQLDVQLRGGDAESDGQKGDRSASLQSRPDLLQNRPALVSRKRQIEELLNKDDDLVARGDTQRSRLSQEAKEIEDRVGKAMLTERQRLYRMGKNPQDYETAVQMTVVQQTTHLKDLQRWQEIMRQLFPDDPTACDVRRIKPK